MVNYPTSLDTDGTLYNVTDNVDYVLAIHHNALKDAVIAIETALGITGAFNFTTDAEFAAHATGNPSAHHVATVAGDLNHNDLANIDAGDIKHITAAQLGALHAVVVAGDLNHNDLANIDAGDIKHITAAQLGALHAIYALTNDLAANEITVIQAIDDASINNTKWDYIAALTEDPQTHMTAGNPHSSSASDTDLSNHASATATHGVAQVANHAEIASQIATHAALTATHGVSQVADNADLHNQAHALATSGDHTGTLPLTDLEVGVSGDIIIRGAADWEILNKGSDTDVLTLVSGVPDWVAQGAPGVHDIITGHNDSGLTIGDVITATGAATFAWQTPTAIAHNLDSSTHSDVAATTEAKGMLLWWNGSNWIGLTDPATVGHMLACDNVDGTISWQAPAGGGAFVPDQSFEVQCIPGWQDDADADLTLSTYHLWDSKGAADPALTFHFPLPTRIGSLRFYATSVQIHLQDADSDDMVTYVRWWEWEGGVYTETNNGGTDYTTVGEHTWAIGRYADTTYGEGAHVTINLQTSTTTSGQLDIAGVSVIGYYT